MVSGSLPEVTMESVSHINTWFPLGYQLLHSLKELSPAEAVMKPATLAMDQNFLFHCPRKWVL